MSKLKQLILLGVAFWSLGAAMPVSAALPLGSSAPDFSALDLSMKYQTLSSFRGRPIVLFFFCGCKLCHATARAWVQTLRKNPAAARGSKTIVIFTGDSSEAKAFERTTGIDSVASEVLLDPTANISTLLYDADPCPCAFVLTSQQVVAYSNDHARDPEHEIVAGRLIKQIQSVLASMPATDKIAAVSASLPSPQLTPLSTGGTTVAVDQGLTEAKFDFGSIDRTKLKSVEHVFELKNNTGSVITISGIQPSCGCTNAFINGSETFPIQVQPGQTVEATTYVDLTDLYAGDVEKSVYVFGRPGGDSIAYLEMDGRILPGT